MTLEETSCDTYLKDKNLIIPTAVPLSRLWDMLTTAFEGGSNYWIKWAHKKPGEDWDKLPGGAYTYTQDVPFLGGTLLIELIEDPGPKIRELGKMVEIESSEGRVLKGRVWELDYEALQRGAKVMAGLKHGEGGHHWPNFLNQRDDAETGDVYLQCCLFGEIVFS